MGKDNEKEKQTGFLHKSREAVFEFLTDPDYTLWAEQRDKENLDYQIEHEADGLGDEFLLNCTPNDRSIITEALNELLKVDAKPVAFVESDQRYCFRRERRERIEELIALVDDHTLPGEASD